MKVKDTRLKISTWKRAIALCSSSFRAFLISRRFWGEFRMQFPFRMHDDEAVRWYLMNVKSAAIEKHAQLVCKLKANSSLLGFFSLARSALGTHKPFKLKKIKSAQISQRDYVCDLLINLNINHPPVDRIPIVAQGAFVSRILIDSIRSIKACLPSI